MQKYKQIQCKEVVYSFDEWKLIEKLVDSILMKTGAFIKRMLLDGHITYFNISKAGKMMKALRIIGTNINQMRG